MHLAAQFDYATAIDLLGLIVKTSGFLDVKLDRLLGEPKPIVPMILQINIL